MLNRKLSLLHILVSCVLTSIYKVQLVGKLDDMPHYVKVNAKLCIVVLKVYGSSLVQAKDNNTNGINEMASMLWDIIASCESKHTW